MDSQHGVIRACPGATLASWNIKLKKIPLKALSSVREVISRLLSSADRPAVDTESERQRLDHKWAIAPSLDQLLEKWRRFVAAILGVLLAIGTLLALLVGARAFAALAG